MRKKIVQQMVTMFTASIAFVAALAWNEAVQSALSKLYLFQDKRIAARFLYAIFITVLAVLVSSILAGLIKDD